MNYQQQIKTGAWQRKRLKIMERDGFKCRCCPEVNYLSVHHLCYLPGVMIWEYDDEALVTVCEKCHEILNKELSKLSGIIAFNILRGKIDIAKDLITI